MKKIKSKNQKMFSFSLMILLSIFLVSCSFFTSKQEADITGTGGLIINLPKTPSTMYPGQGLEIPVTIENAGTYPLTNAILAITGYTENYVKFSSPTKYEGINLEGKSATVPVGEKTTKIFSIGSVALPDAKEKKETFYVVGCYQYKTEASPVVCINPQLASGATIIQGCNFPDAKLSTNQGAPIAVTKVLTTHLLQQKQVAFDIYVKDVYGAGIVLDPAAYAKRCLSNEPLTDQDQNKVYLEAYLSGEKLKCQLPLNGQEDSKFIILSKDETFAMRCFANMDLNQPGFTTPLSVYLTYGYSSGKTFSITLKNPRYNQ